jgi:hypothetical protein
MQKKSEKKGRPTSGRLSLSNRGKARNVLLEGFN